MKQSSETVLFFSPYGNWQVHNQLDLAVASAARQRGLRTTYVTCDAFYQPCAMDRGQADCGFCQGSMNEIASSFSISGEPLGALVTADEIEKAEVWVQSLDDASLVTATYVDLEVGDWALSTVMTHFRIGDLADLHRGAFIPVHRRFLRDTLLTYWAIERVIDRDRIDAVFLFNGRFYPYRAALEAARSRGLRVLVHERGRIANSFSFFENENCLATKTANQLVSAWADCPLDEQELQAVDHHFSRLLRGHSPNWPSFYDQIKTGDPPTALDIPADAKIVGFFSSSSDEIASQISFAKVTSQFALIDDIAALLAEAGIYLIVRHHPHIGGGPLGSPVESSAFFEAYQRLRSRPTNVRVVMPKDELTSYALFPHLTAAVAPFTSLGLETTAFGIPTLVAQGSISSFDPSYTIDDWSISALRNKIAFLLSPCAALDGERLRKFYRVFYSRFHRFSMLFDVVKITDYVRPSVSPDFAELIRLGRDNALDRVLAYLIEGRHVHQRPDLNSLPSDTSRAVAENSYIAKRLSAISSLSRRGEYEEAERAPDLEKEDIAFLCEESNQEPTFSENLRSQPGSKRVLIVPFHPRSPSKLRSFLDLLSGSKASKETREFSAWSRGLRKALRDVDANHVIVLSERYQLHDASIATIIAYLRSEVDPARPVMSLSGWFRDPASLSPSRVIASLLTLTKWHQLRNKSPNRLRGQDILSLAVVRKDWLQRNLKTADHLQAAFFDDAANFSHPSSPTSPVFLWQ